MVVITAGLWKFTPGSLVPDEDQGYYIAAVFLPEGSSLERTDKVMTEVLAAIQSNPANEYVVAFTGFDFLGGGYKNNAATIFVTQKHWDERKVSVQELVGEFFGKTGHIKEALVLGFARQQSSASAIPAGFEVYIQNRGEGGAGVGQCDVRDSGCRKPEQSIGRRADIVAARLRRNCVSTSIAKKRRRSAFRSTDVIQYTRRHIGYYYVNDFNKYGRAWQVLMSADSQYRKRPDDIGRIYVRSDRGAMVPVSAFSKVEYSAGPDSLDRYNNLPAVKLLGQAAPGHSSGEAIAEMERIATQVLPSDMSYDWSGSSFQEKRASGTSGIALILAAVMAFLILAAQYEKWSLPFSVLMAMPFGIFGSLAAIWLTSHIGALIGKPQLTNDVYFQIGLVTLLGLAAKNAILIVEFAVHEERKRA